MHAMQVLPLFTCLLPTSLGTLASRVLVVFAAVAYAALTSWTVVQAVNGQSLIQ